MLLFIYKKKSWWRQKKNKKKIRQSKMVLGETGKRHLTLDCRGQTATNNFLHYFCQYPTRTTSSSGLHDPIMFVGSSFLKFRWGPSGSLSHRFGKRSCCCFFMSKCNARVWMAPLGRHFFTKISYFRSLIIKMRVL